MPLSALGGLGRDTKRALKQTHKTMYLKGTCEHTNAPSVRSNSLRVWLLDLSLARRLATGVFAAAQLRASRVCARPASGCWLGVGAAADIAFREVPAVTLDS